MELNENELYLEQLEKITGGENISFFDRGKTLAEQEAYVRENFRIAKSMHLSYQYACELEIIKASKYKDNLLSDARIKAIGAEVYTDSSVPSLH